MNEHWAAENLQTIRTLMERTALYRRALAPVMICTGSIGVAAGIVGWLAGLAEPKTFACFWLGMALVALTGAFLVVRKQAVRDSEPFWSPPTRRVAQALLPSFYIGLVAGVLVGIFSDDEGVTGALVPVWMALYGSAVHAAGFFMPRGIKWLGWLFIAAATLLIIGLAALSEQPDLRYAHLAMGGLFGGLHLAYGVYLYATERCQAKP